MSTSHLSSDLIPDQKLISGPISGSNHLQNQYIWKKKKKIWPQEAACFTSICLFLPQQSACYFIGLHQLEFIHMRISQKTRNKKIILLERSILALHGLFSPRQAVFFASACLFLPLQAACFCLGLPLPPEAETFINSSFVFKHLHYYYNIFRYNILGYFLFSSILMVL